MKRLLLLHTVSPLIDVFNELCTRLLPGVTVLHILDEPLLKMIQGEGGTERDFIERIEGHARTAETVKAGVMLVTCSSVSPFVDMIRKPEAIHVLKIDDAMIEKAVESGDMVGVIATGSSTLGPTEKAIDKKARETGKEVVVKTHIVERALESLLKGDVEMHDMLVAGAVSKMSKETDVVVLAQASMARVLDYIAEKDRPVPVLSSPHLALGRVKNIL
jgi:Asp/Glu/hydantoin racemase